MAKKFTFIRSFLNDRRLDKDCFEDGELCEDDFVDEKPPMKKGGREDITTKAFIGASVLAAAMISCSIIYYTTKGTVELFKVVGSIAHKKAKL